MSALRVPPWVVRRLMIAPLMPVLAVVALVLLPFAAIGSAAVALVRPARWRALRVVTVALLYLTLQTCCLLACLGTWIASGFGWRLRAPASERRHLALLGWFLDVLVRAAPAVLGVRMALDEPGAHGGDVTDLAPTGAPLVVLGRHAGPGASFLLVHLLAHRYRRSPCIVLKRELRLDPALDVLLGRLRCRFIDSAAGGDAATGAVADLAGTLRHGDALVLFPEGGNWTPERRHRAIRRLRRAGRHQAADRAVDMPHVLPPRPAGAFAALRAAPEAGAIVFTHTGLDDLTSAGAVWRALPAGRTLRMAWWRTPSHAVPRATEEELTAWLTGQWQQVDTWIDEQQTLARVLSVTAPADEGESNP